MAGILRMFAFVAPLGALAALMMFGERMDDGACPGNLAYIKSEELLEQQPGVIDVARQGFRWVGECRFAMTGYVDLDKGTSIGRAGFEVVVAMDTLTGRWQQVSLVIQR